MDVGLYRAKHEPGARRIRALKPLIAEVENPLMQLRPASWSNVAKHGGDNRRCRLDDATAVAAIYDPIVADTTISFENVPPGAVEIRRRIADAGDRFPWLVFERDGIVAGYVTRRRIVPVLRTNGRSTSALTLPQGREGSASRAGSTWSFFVC